MQEKQIVMYAIGEKGQGRVMEIGRFESIEDIEIAIGLFDKDTVISLEYAIDDLPEVE